MRHKKLSLAAIQTGGSFVFKCKIKGYGFMDYNHFQLLFKLIGET